jgi:hypothetical protein
MDLSKTVALTAVLFMVVLILTSGNSLGLERAKQPARKANEANFERSRTNQAARPAGTEYGPTKRAKKLEANPCQYKPVMTEADMAACRKKK